LNPTVCEWISGGLSSFRPSRELAFKALRHLSKRKKEDLFLENGFPKYIAIGQWYEAVIYERLLELARRDTGYAVVGKWADVPWRMRIASKLGQDGLYYDETGAIVARGNGQDLAEFDFIVRSGKSEIAFAEITNSKNNLEEFDGEIRYKKRLLSSLLGIPVQFILVSRFDVVNKPAIKRILSESGNFYVVTNGLDEAQSNLRPEIVCGKSAKTGGFSTMLLSDFNASKINYLENHDSCREELVNAVIEGRPTDFGGESWIVKRIIVGYLSNSCIMVLLNEKNLVIQGKKLTSESFHVFSRVVLALNLPDLRPVLYLRARKKPVYLKIGPFTTSTFKFERNIRRRRTAFFDWLERAQPEIGPDLMNSIMNRYLNDGVTGSRRKPGESPDII